MVLRKGPLHQCLFQHLFCVARTYPALLAHTQAGFQIPHPIRTLVDSLANCGIGYTFADTNIHDERPKSTISTIWLKLACRYAFGVNGIVRLDAG